MSPALRVEKRLGLFPASKASETGVKIADRLNRSLCTIDNIIETAQSAAHAPVIHQKSEDQRPEGT